jgi:hypothetical protein
VERIAAVIVVAGVAVRDLTMRDEEEQEINPKMSMGILEDS